MEPHSRSHRRQGRLLLYHAAFFGTRGRLGGWPAGCLLSAHLAKQFGRSCFAGATCSLLFSESGAVRLAESPFVATRLLRGMDLTLVWLLGFIPVWILGEVDCHGSRLLELRRIRWPTSLAVTRMLTRTFEAHGVPARMLTDNASAFSSGMLEDFLAQNIARHSRIRPAHAWTNGRIERLFRIGRGWAVPAPGHAARGHATD